LRARRPGRVRADRQHVGATLVDTRHPQHDLLAIAVRSWYTSSAPEMGFETEERRFGFYMRNPRVPDGRANRVTLRDVSPDRVPELLADLRAFYGAAPVRILIDDRPAAA